MTLNSTGLGVGVTPSAWGTNSKVVQVGGGSAAVSSTGAGSTASRFTHGCYFDNTNWIYQNNSVGAALYQVTGANTGSTHAWYTSTGGTAGNTITDFATAKMTLDATGNLHVGTTAYLNTGTNFVNSLNGFNIVPDNTANAANRNWNLAANGGAAGNLDFVISSANNTFPNSAYRMQLTSAGALNNTTGTYGTISDLRLKENISDARNYLADLLKLRVVKYSLKEESSTVATKLGFIAQEVELVFPNLVDQSDKEYDGAEGIRSVKTSILIPMLLKAIQELTARVQTLEAR
jgi:adhesin HecA-like repeat protein